MDILQVLVLVFALSIGVILLFHRIRMPAIIGFLLTGVLVGPHGLGLIGDSDVQLLAQIGVVLLLFTVGMEFSLKDIGRMKKPLFLGGFLQVFLTLGIAAFIAVQLGLTFQQGIFVGFLIALSSTAIILKLLQDRGEVYSPHGQIVIAISIFQDIVAVLMMLFIPTLAGAESSLPAALWVLAKGFGIIAAVIMAARWLVPRVLHTIAMTRTRELFLITVAVICFAVAWLTSSIGLSLALGAFLAGLILADSEYGDQALANMLPFRDVFMSLFFVSIGMLLDVNILRSNLSLILLLALGIIVLKSVVAAATAFLLGMPARIASLVGVALAPMSEFGFILSAAALSAGLLTAPLYGTLLAVSIITMAAAPLLFALSPRIAASATALSNGNSQQKVRLKGHVIIVGMGTNGAHVAQAVKSAGIPYIILDMNPERVRAERHKGESILFGDAIAPSVLETANIREARLVMIAIADSKATRYITSVVRSVAPKVTIIVRTPYVSEEATLRKAGADYVVMAERETSLELSRVALSCCGVSQQKINAFVKSIR